MPPSFPEVVSIPYGTIKSHPPGEGCRGEFVSIPYGTIKSLSVLRDSNGWYSVSIPYGTIKRIEGDHIRLRLNRFNSIWYD